MVEASIADHALGLDRHSQAGDAMLHQVEQRLKRQFDATTNTIATAQAAQAVDTTGAALRPHVYAQDTEMTSRIDKAESALHAALSALDVGPRVHTQEAVGATQRAVEGLAERPHLLETARGLSASPAAPTNGRWREQDPVVGARVSG